MKTRREALLTRINRKNWWHVPPADPRAHAKRGKFYSSTFRESLFWGRPLDTPERVVVRNPLVGDEPEVWRILFGKQMACPALDSERLLDWRWKLDARMRRAALKRGYDAIAIMSTPAFKKFKAGRLPSGIELNVLSPAGA